jgi:predicted nicotinamide N-methyase
MVSNTKTNNIYDGLVPGAVLASDTEQANEDPYYGEESDSDSSNYDACDEIFKQGDYLRMLRQIQLEDEAQRELERQKQAEEEEEDDDDGNSNSNTFEYRKFLLNQKEKYDDYKHVNYQYINFGVPNVDYGANNADDTDEIESSAAEEKGNQSLVVIEQDRSLGKGGLIWDAGFVLAEHVLRMEARGIQVMPRCGENTRIIELGAGTGVTSLLIAAALPSTTVHLTDLPLLMPLLEKNCRACCPQNATCGVLEWGKQPFGDDVKAPYDIILAADVVAGIYDSSGLAKTIYELSHANTVIYLGYRERLSGCMDRFEDYMQEMFTVVERCPPDSTNQNPKVFVLKITGKRMTNSDGNIQVVS